VLAPLSIQAGAPIAERGRHAPVLKGVSMTRVQGDHSRLHSRAARAALGAFLLVGLGSFAPFRAAAQYSGAAAVDSGTVTFATDQDASDIDPANNEVAGADVIARNVQEPLVELDGTSLTKFKPVLATSWKSNANDSIWTFTLRQGVKFHTGHTFTSADVKYNVVRDFRSGLVNSYFWTRFLTNPEKQIKILGPYSIEFDLGASQPLFVDNMSSLYAATLLDSVALKAHITKADPWAHQWAQTADIGTGPYMIQSWQHGTQITLAKFADYWGGWNGPHFSKVIIDQIPAGTTRRELVEKGKADITFDLTPQDAKALQSNPAVNVIAPYGTEVDYFYMTQSGPLASPLARQALSYAFNYDAALKGVWGGLARRAYGCLPSNMLGYDPSMFHYNTDLSKAKALLQQAGVKQGTTLTFWSYTAQQNQEGLILQAQLAQIGITLNVKQVPEATLSTVLYGKMTPDRPNLLAFGWWPDYNDPWDECNVLLNSASAGPNGANAGYYHDSAVDSLLGKMKTAGGETLISLSHQMQEAQAKDPAAIWTEEPAQVTILAKNIHGYIFNGVKLQTYGFYTMYRS
jgi:peptide/nickel transport system substrate-binding protein